MIERLHISNYAIIPHLDIVFNPGLTIITGETGAGKSILLGALGIALGKRADTRVIATDESKCVVEAQFNSSNPSLIGLFDRHELDHSTEITFRREITANGKSRSFINDTPVSLKVMQEIAGSLIELHHQHDHLSMQDPEYQLHVLDTLCGNETLITLYTKSFTTWSKAIRELQKAKETAASAARKRDFLRFQLEELDKAELKAGETTQLEEQQQLLENAEQIEQVLGAIRHTLQSGQHGVENQLTHLIKQAESVARVFPPLEELSRRLISLRLEVQDVAMESDKWDGPGQHDPAKLQRIQQRLNQLYTLIKKYNCRDESQLIQQWQDIKKEYLSIETADERIDELEKESVRLYAEVLSNGKKLSKVRTDGSKKHAKGVVNILHELGMPNAQFQINVRETDTPTPEGLDEIQFLFSANKGSQPQPLQHVASGGELSRVSLALKSLYAQKAALPTIVFDEIDTGISGEVAWRMGQLITQMSSGHQILMITHSPQIAAHAEQHLHVSKVMTSQKDHSQITLLDKKMRVQEIAKMLSGDPPSKSAIQNATELIASAR